MIAGWQEMISFTGLSKAYLLRASKLYGFPVATRTARKGRGLFLAWDKVAVEQWLEANDQDVREQKAKRLKFDHTWRNLA